MWCFLNALMGSGSAEGVEMQIWLDSSLDAAGAMQLESANVRA
jgi:hypothetical protein